MSDPDFWLAPNASRSDAGGRERSAAEEKIKELGEIKDVLQKFAEVEKGIAALKKEFNEKTFFEIRKKFRQLEIRQLFRGPHDKQAAVISIYPGVGGEDAEDWARMLSEMYEKYAANRGWKITVLDDSPNRRTFEVNGDYAYGYLKGEAGVHRLVRISPFSAKKMRHTSFALVEVIPVLPPIEEEALYLPEKDLKFEFYRAGGPGGQNVNKVETAVRVVHLPTNLSASSQAERSQIQNREKALKLLKAKILQLMEKEQAKEIGELRVKVKPEWGNQIRSYVLNPYQLVKDHRSGVETAKVHDVLNGDIDIFVEAEVELLS